MGTAAEPPRNAGLSSPLAAAVLSAAWCTPATAAKPTCFIAVPTGPGQNTDGASCPRPTAAAQGPAPRISEGVLLQQVLEHGLQVCVRLRSSQRSVLGLEPMWICTSHTCLRPACRASYEQDVIANHRNGDPGRPCNSDWKKYGKDFSGALAHSYGIAPKPGSNGTTSAATNFQRPLPQRQAAPPPQQYGGGGYGGGYGGGGYGGGWQPQFRPAYGPPPGALVLQPGDPRIGGQ